MKVVSLAPLPSKRFRLQSPAERLDFSVIGTAVIGRAGSCDITLFDPLVSRHHARITIKDDKATIEDLASHNGTRVNGARIRGVQRISSGDRIGLGKHELVLCEVTESIAPQLDTAVLVYCASCQLTYPKQEGSCPHCHSTETVTQVTRSGVFDEASRNEWALEMLVSVFAKAVSAGDRDRAESLLREIIERVDSAGANGPSLAAPDLRVLVKSAVALSQMTGDEHWSRWAEQASARASFLASIRMLQSM